MQLIYGFHPVREALRERPGGLRRVLVARGRGGPRRDELRELCQRHGVRFELRPEGDLERLAPGVHNGFVAELGAVAVAPVGIPALAAGAAAEAAPVRQADEELLVLVEDVQDPRNLGALLRVCEGAGVARVMVRDRGSAPLTPTVTKTAAGATAYLPVERVTNSAQEIARAKADGFWVYAVEPGGPAPWELDLSGKVLLCFGGEEKGLRERTRGLADGRVGLPMRGRVESLNLATAAAAVLYDVVRQRLTKSRGGQVSAPRHGEPRPTLPDEPLGG
jgi:23S rRNA (guanosine2251-2'-O)-methyltransferase